MKKIVPGTLTKLLRYGMATCVGLAVWTALERDGKAGTPYAPELLETIRYRELDWGTIPAALTYGGYNMSGKVTGGTITIEQTKQIADYQPRKVIVSLNFAVEEGRDAEPTVEHVADLVNRKVAELLGKEAPAKASAAPSADREAKVTKPPKATKAAKAGELDDLPEEPKKPAEAPKDENLDDLLGGELAAPPVTDADLLSKITAHNAKSKNVIAIRTLIGKYNGGVAGKQAKDIPADKRHDFIKELHNIPAV